MNRRGFLGFFGAAAASGPKLASGIAEGLSGSMPLASLSVASSIGCNPCVSDGDWRTSRIANLKRIIAGKDPRFERETIINRLCAAEMRERIRLDGLRSVSPASKYRMLADGEPERRDRLKRQDARFELEDLLKEVVG